MSFYRSVYLGITLLTSGTFPGFAQGVGSSNNPGGHPAGAGSATATYPGAPFRNTMGQTSAFQNSFGQTTRFQTQFPHVAAPPSGASPTNLNNINRGSNSDNSDQSAGTAGTDSSPGSYAAYSALARKLGRAPNGLPIGTTGSGPGSPEQPIDSGSR